MEALRIGIVGIVPQSDGISLFPSHLMDLSTHGGHLQFGYALTDFLSGEAKTHSHSDCCGNVIEKVLPHKGNRGGEAFPTGIDHKAHFPEALQSVVGNPNSRFILKAEGNLLATEMRSQTRKPGIVGVKKKLAFLGKPLQNLSLCGSDGIQIREKLQMHGGHIGQQSRVGIADFGQGADLSRVIHSQFQQCHLVFFHQL